MIILPILLTVSVMCISPSYLKLWKLNSVQIYRKLSFSDIIWYNAMFLGKIKNTYPGSKPVIFVLFVSRYKMIWVPSVPPKFVFLMSWHIYVLKIATRRFWSRSIPSFCKLLLWKWLLFLKITLRKGVDGKSGKTSLQI